MATKDLAPVCGVGDCTYGSAFLPRLAMASVDTVASNSQKGMKTGCSLCSLPNRLLECRLKQWSRWYCTNADSACCGVTEKGNNTGAGWPLRVAAGWPEGSMTQRDNGAA